MSLLFTRRMKKKAILQDVIEFGFAFGFIFIVGIFFVSCQEMKSSSVDVLDILNSEEWEIFLRKPSWIN